MIEVLSGGSIIAAEKGAADAAGGAMIVGGSLVIHQAITGLRHGFFPEQMATTTFIDKDQEKPKLSMERRGCPRIL